MNLCNRLTARAKSLGHAKNVLEFYNDELKLQESCTIEEFDKKIRQFAYTFQMSGLKTQDRVAIYMESGPEFVFSFLGALSAGMIAIPLSFQLSKNEVNSVILQSHVNALLIDGASTDTGDDFHDCFILDLEIFINNKTRCTTTHQEIDDDQAAFIIYTSGTTGRPRGVVHAHRVLDGRVPMLDGWTDIRSGDRVLHAGKLNWSYTLGVGLFDPIMQGATALLFSGAGHPQIWPELIRKTRASIFATVPSVYRQILKYNTAQKLKMKSLRHVLSAGEKLSDKIQSDWMHYTGTNIYEALGMSEYSTYISSSIQTGIVSGSIGKIQSGRKVCLLPELSESANQVESGQTGILGISINDPGFMLGYDDCATGKYEIPETMLRGEWFLSGDLAWMDEHGYIYYAGRNDDTLNVFGYRINALEVESVLVQWEFAEEAAVGIFSETEELQLLAAWVVLNVEEWQKFPPSSKDKWKSELLLYLDNRLARYKQPRKIFFVDQLPRSRNGKLQRNRLSQIKNCHLF